MSKEILLRQPVRLVIAIPAHDRTIASILPVYPKHEHAFLKNEIPIDLHHPFETKNQEIFARWLLQKTRMPLTRVTSLAYRPNDYTNHGVLGSTEMGGIYDGRLTLYKDLNRIPAIGQLGVAVHELAHSSSPFDRSTAGDYGSEINRLKAANNVINIANQSATTGIFLNQYQRELFLHLIQGNISPRRWFEENHAITMELAATNPAHLKQVEIAQYFTLLRQGRQHDFVRLTSKFNRRTGEQIICGTDEALLHLTRFSTITALHDHWQELRDTLKGDITPLHIPFLRRPVKPVLTANW